MNKHECDPAVFKALLNNPGVRWDINLWKILRPLAHDRRATLDVEYRANVNGVYLDEFIETIECPLPAKVKGHIRLRVAHGSDGGFRVSQCYLLHNGGCTSSPSISDTVYMYRNQAIRIEGRDMRDRICMQIHNDKNNGTSTPIAGKHGDAVIKAVAGWAEGLEL